MASRKSDDIEVANIEKAVDPVKPSPVNATSLDEGELFLKDNNVSDDALQELLSDDAQVRRLVRKVDLTVLPLLAGTFILQFIDKQALSYAAVFDLFSDTNITQSQYSWFASMFYLAYLVAEYPWTALAQRTRMAKVISVVRGRMGKRLDGYGSLYELQWTCSVSVLSRILRGADYALLHDDCGHVGKWLFRVEPVPTSKVFRV